MLSRVREEYLRTGDNNAATVRGVSGTGGRRYRRRSPYPNPSPRAQPGSRYPTPPLLTPDIPQSARHRPGWATYPAGAGVLAWIRGLAGLLRVGSGVEM
jgi:hypothetical protein